jgi:hypothetical protein
MRIAPIVTAVVLWSSSASAAGVCLGLSPLDEMGTVDCDPVNPQLWPSHVVGYSQFDVPCEFGTCEIFDPAAGSNQYGWTISSSDVDPYVNTGPLDAPLTFLYLWYECNSSVGVQAAEFAVEVDDPGLVLIDVSMRNGWLNAATDLGDLLIVVGGCPPAPIVAAQFLLLNVGTVSVEEQSWSGIKSLYR